MEKIKNQESFHLKLNSFNELSVLLSNNETKIYEVVLDMISVNLIEHIADNVIELKDNQGKRYMINGMALDFYDCEDCSEYIKKSSQNDTWVSTSFYFVDKELAETKLNIEKQKLTVRNLNLAFT